MAYENINVYVLRSTLYTIKNIKINKYGLKNVGCELTSDGWSGNTRNRIISAIDKTTEYHDAIIDYINNLLQATDYIEEYKNLDKENEAFDNRVNIVQRRINNLSSDVDSSLLKNDVNNYKNRISSNNSKKSELQRKINELVNREARL